MDIFDEIRRMQREMDRMFSDFYSRPPLTSGREEGGREIRPANYREPPLDVIDKGNELLVQVELPGVDKENIDVDLGDNTLTIKASKRKVKTEEKEGYFYQERGYAGYYRTIPLPVEVEEDKIKAKYNNGVLEITMPKRPEDISTKKKIEIE